MINSPQSLVQAKDFDASLFPSFIDDDDGGVFNKTSLGEKPFTVAVQ